MAFSSCCSCTHTYLITLLLVFSTYFQKEMNYCNASQTFGFEMHHRFSDHVKSILGGDNLPEKGSPEYYAVMIHRDRVFRGRALAENDDNSKLLTFSEGSKTIRYDYLGSLHYAHVSLGTPSLSFLVALDTGSDIFWVPCDCTNCTRIVVTSPFVVRNLNIYSSNSSSTSKYVPGSSRLCEPTGCFESSSQCPFNISYKDNSSTCGVFVEDVLHLATDSHKAKAVDARIAFGCGQTILSPNNIGTPNGLLGLSPGYKSVPSILSSQGLIANSFSMCFGFDGAGRINFGDKGSLDQHETPFNNFTQTTYHEVSVTKLSVGKNLSDLLEFSAIFDSGTTYTSLSDPAYTAISERFDSQVIHKRHPFNPRILFEYCYDVSLNSTEFDNMPKVSLIMEGGSQFIVNDPIVSFDNGMAGTLTYCLAVTRSPDINIIGQNFMTGYRIVYDREKMKLGWKASNCTDEIMDPSTQPKTP